MNSNILPQAVQEYFQAQLPGAMDYKTFRTLVSGLLEEGKVTGNEQTEALLEYTRINETRMNRWDKHLVVNAPLAEKIKSMPAQTWLVITEGWCGDGAQNLPVFHKLTEINPAIQMKLVLRDEHPALMEAYLTNGSRSIPKVIAISRGQELWQWGPRPAQAQAFIDEAKRNGADMKAAKEQMHLWYARDKQHHLQAEILKLICD